MLRFHSSTNIDVRAAHARIIMHKRHGHLPSTEAIRDWVEQHPAKRQGIRDTDVKVALDSGEEVGVRH
jgi:hypothetical protein